MAPTEVLAGQHFRSMAALLGPFGAVPYLRHLDRPANGPQGSLFEVATGSRRRRA